MDRAKDDKTKARFEKLIADSEAKEQKLNDAMAKNDERQNDMYEQRERKQENDRFENEVNEGKAFAARKWEEVKAIEQKLAVLDARFKKLTE